MQLKNIEKKHSDGSRKDCQRQTTSTPNKM